LQGYLFQRLKKLKKSYLQREMKVNSFYRCVGKLFLFLLIFIFTGCESNTPINIGFVAGISGKFADLGISGMDAVQLLVDEVNAKGGINGRRLNLIIKDDRQDPETARQAVQQLLDNNVEAIIGPMTSDMSMAVVPLLDKAQIVTVSPTSTTQLLSGLDDYFFRVSSTTKDYAGKSARYHGKKTKIKRMVATYDLSNRSFTENWLENFTEEYTRNGGELIDAIGFDTKTDMNLLHLAEKLLSKNSDGILIIANSMDAAIICQQLRKLNKDIYITLADWGATERLLELGGNSITGVTVIQTFDRDSTAHKYQEFRKDFGDRYKREPGFPGVYTRDAVSVIFRALEEQQKGESLKETILKIRHFEGLQGKFSFDDFGDVQRSSASISVVRDGKFEVIE
jgi:branched-chain amino acid transport system substrate-binding protein